MSRSIKGRLVGAVIATGCVTAALPRFACAEPPPAPAESTSSWTTSRSLSQHFGVESARRLLAGGDAQDGAALREEVLRGIDRAVGLGSPEAIALLVHVLSDSHSLARSDANVLLALTRALAPFAGKSGAARALADVVLNGSAPPPRARANPSESPASLYDPDREARLELARGTAALALADAHDELALDLLTSTARRPGPGQVAATIALVTVPPVLDSTPPTLTPGTSVLNAATGDLRARDAILDGTRSLDPTARVASLRAAATLGDVRAVAAAEEAFDGADPSTRVATARALVALDARGAASAVRRLIEDDTTADRGIELSVRVDSGEVVGALAARIRASSNERQRRDATLALQYANDARALDVLVALLADPHLAGEATDAIARATAPGAWDAILAVLLSPSAHRSGARMAAIRGRARGDIPARVHRALRDLSRAVDGADRAAALAALVMIDDASPSAGLADPDVRVRRAVAMACEPTDPKTSAELVAHLATEKDPVTRLLLARGLASPDADGVTTTALADHVLDGDIDAPLAILALARTGDRRDQDMVKRALGSPDPVFRAHAARGLGEAREPWVVSLLSDAYDAEVDPGVRRVLTLALAAVGEDSPVRARALDHAARFDPDPGVRTIAARARVGLSSPVLPRGRDSACFHVGTDTGAPPPPPTALGVVVRADGLALPVAFDEDGYALIPAPRGPSRLALAPRLRAYEAASHGD